MRPGHGLALVLALEHCRDDPVDRLLVLGGLLADFDRDGIEGLRRLRSRIAAKSATARPASKEGQRGRAKEDQLHAGLEPLLSLAQLVGRLGLHLRRSLPGRQQAQFSGHRHLEQAQFSGQRHLETGQALGFTDGWRFF